MSIKERLTNLVDYAHRLVAGFADDLPAAERDETGSFEHWSAKDMLAHLMAWEEEDAQVYTGAAEEIPDADQQNAVFYAALKDISWAELFERQRSAQAEVDRAIAGMAEDSLSDSDAFAWTHGRPPWRWIAGTSYMHPTMHLVSYHIERGRLAAAMQLMEQAVEHGARLTDAPAWVGLLRYNLACICALSGDKPRAIEALGDSLALNPDLREWSQQDADLASLRAEPAYQALYTA